MHVPEQDVLLRTRGLYVGGASISGPAQQQCVSSSDERRGLGARGKPRRAVLG